MSSGVKITCKKVFGSVGQFLITEKPYCTINDTEKEQLEWGKETFVPLPPNVPLKITVQFPYSAYPDRACGLATISTQLHSDEIQTYEYRTPVVVYHAGKIKRKS